MLGLSNDLPTSVAPAPRPVRGRSIAAASALIAQVLFCLVASLVSAHRLALANQLQAGIPVAPETAQASDWALRIIATSSLLLLIPTAILFLVWFHRAHQNLAAFRLGAFEHSPRGAVFSFFIPFLNLVQPYLVMKEIWQASDPAIPPFDQGLWPATRTSPLLGIWWTFFLLRGLAGSGVTFASMTMQGIPALRAGALGSLAIYLLGVPSAAAAAILILQVSKRQADLAALLQPSRAEA